MLDRTAHGRDRYELFNILSKMCSRQRMIPNSMRMDNCFDGELTEVDGGGHAYVLRGEHGGRAVAIKTLRLYLTSDLGNIHSVTISFYIVEGRTETGIPGIHPRSRYMEASATPEHPTAAGREHRRRTVQACPDIRMDGSR